VERNRVFLEKKGLGEWEITCCKKTRGGIRLINSEGGEKLEMAPLINKSPG